MEISLPPGIVKVQSGATAVGRFIDCDHVRFVAGKPEKMPGWAKITNTQFDGVPRGLHAYLAPDGNEFIAIGTECFLYTYETASGDVDNITPIRSSSTINNDPFAVTSGQTTVTVTDTLHGATLGATVTFSGATAGGGITISGAYEITSIIDANSYTIEHSIAASSTDSTTGGASVVAAYNINCGNVSSVTSLGYGAGPYGEEDYGDERTAGGIIFDLALWSLDNYGNQLLACRLGEGHVYLYEAGVDTVAEAITNAPTDCRYAFVTGERFITVLQEDMVVSWPDLDDPTDWTPSALNTANTRRLSGGNKLIAGARFQRLQNLIWSDKCLFLHEFTGSSFVYVTTPVGSDCGLSGPNAFCITDGAAFWMSPAGFQMFSGGSVVAVPNQDEVKEFVFRNLDPGEHSKVIANFIAPARVVRFTYPHAASEPNRYVEVNIDTWTWTVGTSERVGRTTEVASSARPIMSSFDGYIYEHEFGLNADGASLGWFIESGLYRLEDAPRAIDIWGFIPDFERIVGTVTLTISGQDRPQSDSLDETSDSDEGEITSQTEIVDLRVAGRYIKFRLEQDEIDSDFRMGTPTVETGEAGARR